VLARQPAGKPNSNKYSGITKPISFLSRNCDELQNMLLFLRRCFVTLIGAAISASCLVCWPLRNRSTVSILPCAKLFNKSRTRVDISTHTTKFVDNVLRLTVLCERLILHWWDKMVLAAILFQWVVGTFWCSCLELLFQIGDKSDDSTSHIISNLKCIFVKCAVWVAEDRPYCFRVAEVLDLKHQSNIENVFTFLLHTCLGQVIFKVHWWRCITEGLTMHAFITSLFWSEKSHSC
jgi:hypothetical protein